MRIDAKTASCFCSAFYKVYKCQNGYWKQKYLDKITHSFITSIYSTIIKILVNLKRMTFTIRSCDFPFSHNYRNITKLWIDMNTFTAFVF